MGVLEYGRFCMGGDADSSLRKSPVMHPSIRCILPPLGKSHWHHAGTARRSITPQEAVLSLPWFPRLPPHLLTQAPPTPGDPTLRESTPPHTPCSAPSACRGMQAAADSQGNVGTRILALSVKALTLPSTAATRECT